jgi:hypothetical protein
MVLEIILPLYLFYFYQQSGDAKKLYFEQYSAVCEDTAVRVITNMKTNIAIKNILDPLNIHFNVFLIEVFLVRTDNIINLDCILFYIIIIIHYSK